VLQLVAGESFSFVWREDLKRWLLQEGRAGLRSLPLRDSPFKVGRAPDCGLVLPDSEALCRLTSRWHCHFIQDSGGWTVRDGSFDPVPETGQLKPSISGTFRNGRRLWAPEALAQGDSLKVGPWDFGVEDSGREVVDIDRVLQRIGPQDSVVLTRGDSGALMGYKSLDELFSRLHLLQDSEECLGAILAFAMDKMPSAQVAAVLIFNPGEEPAVRLAWQRDVGRIAEFRFSSGLIKALPADQAFLVRPRIEDATQSQVEHNISSGLLVPLRGRGERLGVLYLDNRNCGRSFQEADLYLANALASVASLQLSLERQAYLTRVEQNMRQYFGPDVVRLIMEASRQGKPVSLGVKECEASVLFVDIQDFSAFCRGRDPQEVSQILNPYFEIVAESIQGASGHVDKFLGDGVMGVFGSAPIDDPRLTRIHHAIAAVGAARQMIARWSQWSRSRWKQPIHLRVGINTGKLAMGNIGFPGRIEYSALGDTVNLASRIEHLAEPDGIAVSDATYQMLGAARAAAEEVDVRGFGPVKVWRLAA
jgi:adenylate cyclase